MKALIFNSGIGKRMGDFTKTHHKCMAVLNNGETIFERQLRILSSCGIKDFIVTTGPFEEQLRNAAARSDFKDLHFTFVKNPIYDKTNYIYSMYLAREHFDDDVLLLHGDLVFNKRIVANMLADERPNLAVVNKEKPLPEKDFKARVIDGNIREVSIKIFDENCFAFQPLYKLSKDMLHTWTRQVEKFIGEGNDQVYAENALNEIFYDVDIKMYSYVGHFVDEVDNLDDLARVSAQIRRHDFAEQEILTEEDAYKRIPELLERSGAKKPMLVVDSAYPYLFIRDYLNELPIDFVKFDGFSPNPVYEEVEAGVRLFRENKCDFIIAIGGGSAIDTAKNIKLFSMLDPDKNYLEQEYRFSPVQLVALPTTAGTGSESTRFSVLYYKGAKQSIAHDCIVPNTVILDSQFLKTLPAYQKKSTLMDAMCQCIEAIWSVNTDEECRRYAIKGLTGILKYTIHYMRGDERCYKEIMRSANLSGKAINISQTTAAHAMSYKLSSLYKIPHGHSVVLCLPHVWDYMIEKWLEMRDEFDARCEGLPEEKWPAPGRELAHLNKSFEILRQAFGAKTTRQACNLVKFMMTSLELPVPQLAKEEDLDILAKSVNPTRLKNNPVPLSEEVLRMLYEKVFDVYEPPVDENTTQEQLEEIEAAKLKKKYEQQRAAELRELQAYNLEILVKTDAFCRENGLRYYLAEGTMLGAVRHGGFIPWDDDVDIMMPRQDYDRLVRLCREGRLPEGLHLDAMETNKKHWVLGAKIQLKRKTKFTQTKVVPLSKCSGPYIDVFPLEYAPRRFGPKQYKQGRMMHMCRRMLFMKTGYSKVLKGQAKRFLIMLALPFFSTTAIHKMAIKTMNKYNDKPRKFMVNLCSYYPYVLETFPADFFGEPVYVDFEGFKLPVPRESDYMLKTIYGKDYNSMPPAKYVKARRHHFEIDPNFKSETDVFALLDEYRRDPMKILGRDRTMYDDVFSDTADVDFGIDERLIDLSDDDVTAEEIVAEGRGGRE